jgi:2,4-dienoyl-CoA reductase-like NADH-dependent reductase (Old Yellow Enzyme family)
MLTGHSVLYGENGFFSTRHGDYYEERAKGGVGLIITEQQAAHPSGRNYYQGLIAHSADAIPHYLRVTERVKRHGVPILAQLFCGGAQGVGTMYIDSWRPLLSPSGIRSTQFGETPAVMTPTDIEDVKASFVSSARNVIDGGFDGIEIHAAHSQLLGSFLSPAFNNRADDYGGSLENRCRIVIEIIVEVRKAIGREPLIGVRLSASEHLHGAGIDEEECLRQIEALTASTQLDFIDISAGGYFAKSVSVPPMASGLPVGFLSAFSAKVRERVGSKVNLFAVGRVTTLDEADSVLASGRLDMIGMTRAHMADPRHIEKTLAGRQQAIRHCIGANVCAKRLVENNHVTCVMNPQMGREGHDLTHAQGNTSKPEPQRIAVVGGGPAGLSFAARAATLGNDIKLFEASSELGGRLRPLAQLPLRTAWRRGIDNLVRGVQTAGVSIETSVTATPDMFRFGNFDRVVLATGARWDLSGFTPFKPERRSIPGLDLVPVIGLDEAIFLGPKTLGSCVVIVDESGEVTAPSFAIAVAEAGVRCIVVSPSVIYGETLIKTYEYPYVFGRLEKAGARIYSNTVVGAVEPGGNVRLTSLLSERTELIANVSRLVVASGRLPNADLAGPLRERGIRVDVIGDALAPRSIEAVIAEGYQAAERR